jgi:glycosyltransferase involved in cell wall biosynthesis
MEKYDVNVITDSSLYQENKFSTNPNFQIDSEIKIHRVKSRKLDKNNLGQRTMKIVSLSIKLTNVLLKNVRKGEKVFIVTNPALLLVLMSWFKKLKRFQLYVLVHDVFPENTIPSGIIKSKKSLIYKIIYSFFNRAYSATDVLVVLGRDMKKVVETKVRNAKKENKPSIHILENWADIENIKPDEDKPELLKERHKEKFITIQYAGNIGRLQGLENFLQMFSLSANNRLYFDLWGNGALTDFLKYWVIEHNLSNRVQFYGSYAREDQNVILNSADIALVTLSKGMYGLGVPSKTYNILAAGKPVLFIGDLNSEIALMIRERNIGFCFSPDDKNGIIAFLNGLTFDFLYEMEERGRKARIVAEEQYSEERILSRYLEVI